MKIELEISIFDLNSVKEIKICKCQMKFGKS